MAKDKKGQGKFKTWWTGLKSEFSKIIWLNRKTVIKQTVIVIVVTIIVGALITVIDFYSQLGLQQIVSKAMKQDTTTASAEQATVNNQQAVSQAVTKASKATQKKAEKVAKKAKSDADKSDSKQKTTKKAK